MSEWTNPADVVRARILDIPIRCQDCAHCLVVPEWWCQVRGIKQGTGTPGLKRWGDNHAMPYCHDWKMPIPRRTVGI